MLSMNACAVEMMQGGRGELAAPFDAIDLRDKLGAEDTDRFACPPVEAVPADLEFYSIYDQDTGRGSVIDPEAQVIYNETVDPIRDFENSMTSMANRYVKSSPPRLDIAQCGLDSLVEWANGDALLGAVNTTGQSVRKWTLSSVAMAWIQIRDEPRLDPRKRKKVEKWMRDVAFMVKKDYLRDTHLVSRKNNHLYWAAWAVMATGVALEDRGLFDWALRRAEYGIESIQEDGTLPLEMARQRQAINYHSYAAVPLFLMAETALRNGVNLYTLNEGALFRFGRRVVGGFNDPAYFDQRAGERQDFKRGITPAGLAWLEIYFKRSGDQSALKRLEDLRPMRFSRMGGDVTFLYSH